MPTPRPSEASGAAIVRRRVHWVRFGAALVFAALLALVFLLPPSPPPPAVPGAPDEAFFDNAHLVSPGYARSTAGALLNDSRVQIVVFTSSRLPEVELHNWTVQAATDWKIGAANEDTGIVLFVFRDTRIARVEVGYGLEGVLPDAKVRQILESTLAVPFARGAYETGFDAWLAAMREELGGDAGLSRIAATAGAAPDLPWYLQILAAYPRVPRMLLAIWQRFREEGTNARFAILMFVGVAFAIAACGVFLAFATVRRLVALPRGWRETAGQPLVDRFFDLKVLEVVMGPAGVVLCFAFTGVVVIQAEEFFARKGHFGGAGAEITWPAARP